MNLQKYLLEKGLSQAAFAALVGVTQGRVSQWLAGETIPPERAMEIEEKTNGAVCRAELRPDLWKKEAA